MVHPASQEVFVGWASPPLPRCYLWWICLCKSLAVETWWLVRPLVRLGGGFLGPRTVRGYLASHAWLATSRRNSASSATLSRPSGAHSDGGSAIIIPSYLGATS